MKKILFGYLLAGTLFLRAGQVLTPVNTFFDVFENQTADADFKVFVGSGDQRFLLVHNTTFDLQKTHPQLQESIRVSDRMRIDLIEVSGETKSIYIKFGGYASGKCSQDEDGPFYLSLWREFPDAPEINRKYIRYCQCGPVGRLGLRVNEGGDPEIFAVANTTILN